MPSTVARRVYEVGGGTSLIFTDVTRDKEKQASAVTLSIVGNDVAQTKRLGPIFGHALEKVIKHLVAR